MTTKNNIVDGKNIIITGGAQGFGGGIANELFKQGANLIIADINEKIGSEMAETLNKENRENRAFFIKTDVSDAKSVQNLVAETIKYFGEIDVLISNAGILRAGSLEEMSPETFEIVTKVKK